MIRNFAHRLQPELRPSLSWPKPTGMAQASVLEGQSCEKLSFTDGFQAKLSWHNTRYSLKLAHFVCETHEKMENFHTIN